MKILIINSDYPEFLDYFYQENRELRRAFYGEQLKARNQTLFGVADFYSKNFLAIGCEAVDIHSNNEILQRQWASEQGLKELANFGMDPKIRFTTKIKERAKSFLRTIPGCRALKSQFFPQKNISKPTPPLWAQAILQEQIKAYAPDVIINQAMDYISGELLHSMKHKARLVAGQIAAPLPKGEDYYGYDIIFSSLPNFVNEFRRRGIKAEFNKLAFEPSVLDFFPIKEDSIGVAFIGGITADHVDRLKLMAYLCTKVDLKIWGRADKSFLKSVRLRNIQGPLWGMDMYETLNKTKIVVNQHIDIAGNFANNMRLYEATGMGCLLITDWKENMAELFQVDKEIVTYQSPEECADKINYYLNHETERKKIALAGQKRTLREHTYQNRIRELTTCLENML